MTSAAFEILDITVLFLSPTLSVVYARISISLLVNVVLMHEVTIAQTLGAHPLCKNHAKIYVYIYVFISIHICLILVYIIFGRFVTKLGPGSVAIVFDISCSFNLVSSNLAFSNSKTHSWPFLVPGI